MHTTQHPLAGQVVRINDDVVHPQFELAGGDFEIEDWWDRLMGKSWMDCNGNPACMIYALRAADLPIDDEVVYGKFHGLGVLLHVSELEPQEVPA